jgi:hypothetical protein
MEILSHFLYLHNHDSIFLHTVPLHREMIQVDDSIMRVRSKGIAGELMEITFRNNDGKAPEDYEN